jgi:hypothetical protein
VLRQRLSIDFLLNRTAIFEALPNEGDVFDKYTAKQIRARFVAYWSAWVERDLKNLFDELETPVKQRDDIDVRKQIEQMIKEIDKIITKLK